MHFETSPNPSPSQPISIGRMGSPTDSLYNFQRQSSTSPSRSAVCAYPSWPTGNSLCSGSFRTSAPSAFISDEDLFPEDLLDGDAVFLSEAPAPPRDERFVQAFPAPLLPLYAPEKPKKRRRSTRSSKPRRPSKPMTPIIESPETPE